ncbi:MAG TPA: N-acetylmuramoyl-L-alanine amidase [Syntrophomonadaceae bacterium]|nr:N-acetylmuramoyl-L-alanine amidase [Syntrophomonadaceae bacterium]
MARLCFDYGHGGRDPGAVYKGRREKDDNLALGKAVTAELRRHGVIVDETRTGDTTIGLRERSNFENRKKYDYIISFHRNAFKPEAARGAETYTYLNAYSGTTALAQKIQDALVAVGFANRKVKQADFHMLRETKAPAILIEVGFIDNTADNRIFDSKKDAIIIGIAKAILSQLGISYKDAPKPIPTPKGQLPRVAKQIAVRVNGKPVSAKGYLINNTTYLQGLFVAGLFGGSVTGHGSYIDIKVKT